MRIPNGLPPAPLVPPPPPRKPFIRREIPVSTRVRRKLDFYEDTEVEVKKREMERSNSGDDDGDNEFSNKRRRNENESHYKSSQQSILGMPSFVLSISPTGINQTHNNKNNQINTNNKPNVVLTTEQNFPERVITTPTVYNNNNNSPVKFNELNDQPFVSEKIPTASPCKMTDPATECSEVLILQQGIYVTPDKNCTLCELDINPLSSATSELNSSFCSSSSGESCPDH